MNLLDPDKKNTMAQIYEGLFKEDQKLIKSGKTRCFRFEIEPSMKKEALEIPHCFISCPNVVYFCPEKCTDVYRANELFNIDYLEEGFCAHLQTRKEKDENGHTYRKITFAPKIPLNNSLINQVVHLPVIVPALSQIIRIGLAISHVLLRFRIPLDIRKVIINNYIFTWPNWRCLAQNPFNRLAETMGLIWFNPKANEVTLKLQLKVFNPHYGKMLVRINSKGEITLDQAIEKDVIHHPIEQKPDGILVCGDKPFYTIKEIVDTFTKTKEILIHAPSE